MSYTALQSGYGHIESAGQRGWRNFTSSSCRRGHYQTLSVPPNATRNQIKSSYYKLSKVHHPDMSKDPEAKEKFQAVSEAYAVLGDDRKRRAYDRSLTENAEARRPHSAGHSAYAGHWSHETRRRGATYAWEQHARRPTGGYWHRPSQGSPAGSAYQRGPDPFSSPHVQRATGRREVPRTQGGPTDADRVSNESFLWRTVQVVGVVLAVATIGGGLSASAA